MTYYAYFMLYTIALVYYIDYRAGPESNPLPLRSRSVPATARRIQDPILTASPPNSKKATVSRKPSYWLIIISLYPPLTENYTSKYSPHFLYYFSLSYFHPIIIVISS
jgi:hypothetical protein